MWQSAFVTLVLVAVADAAICPTAARENPRDVIAAHIRSQGYPCYSPQSAVRQPRASRPGEQAWLLNCENADYLVRLVPDMAAIVEPIEKKR
jgi:hypothetical protein